MSSRTEYERALEIDARNMFAPGHDVNFPPQHEDWRKWARWKWFTANAPLFVTAHSKAFCGAMDFLSMQPEHIQAADDARIEFEAARLALKREWLTAELSKVDEKQWGVPADGVKEIRHVMAGGRPSGCADNEVLAGDANWIILFSRYGKLATEGVRDDLNRKAALENEITSIEREIAGLCSSEKLQAQERARRIAAAKGKASPAAAKPAEDFDKAITASNRKLRRDLSSGAALVGG